MSKPTRRRFLQAAAVGATLPLLASPTEAGEPTRADDALTAIVRARFRFLNEAQVKAVQAAIQRNLTSAEALRRVTLDPVDEPATIFVADVAE